MIDQPQTPPPDPVAAADQVGATLRVVANVLGQYMEELVTEGFERAEALQIVRDWHTEWMVNEIWGGADDET